MIECRFIYRFSSGGASDSLDQTYKVHSVPRVGEKMSFVADDGTFSASHVKEVVHYINLSKATHEIVVYYGD